MKYLTWFVLFFLCSCKNNTPAPPVSEAASQATLPEGFADFYQRFHTDSLFQMEHIVFPLEGLPDHADSTTIANNDFRWHPEDWTMQRAFDFEMSEYKRDLIPINEWVVQERIVRREGGFGMVRRFARVGGEWNLIYYAGMNRLAN